jgi:hypothetical protein
LRAPLLIAAGSALFLAFWDVDNLMVVATLCLLAGFAPLVAPLWRTPAMSERPA